MQAGVKICVARWGFTSGLLMLKTRLSAQCQEQANGQT